MFGKNDSDRHHIPAKEIPFLFFFFCGGLCKKLGKISPTAAQVEKNLNWYTAFRIKVGASASLSDSECSELSLPHATTLQVMAKLITEGPKDYSKVPGTFQSKIMIRDDDQDIVQEQNKELGNQLLYTKNGVPYNKH